VNEKLGFELADGLLGCTVIVVSGPIVSTSHVNDAGVPSTLPTASMARTWNVCEPCDRLEYDCGLVHATNPPPSSWHSNDATPVPVTSLPVNENAAEVLATGFVGLEVMLVSGAVVSMTHVYDAGVGSVLEAPSIARTWNVCEPSARPT